MFLKSSRPSKPSPDEPKALSGHTYLLRYCVSPAGLLFLIRAIGDVDDEDRQLLAGLYDDLP